MLLKGYKRILKSANFLSNSAAYVYRDGVALKVDEKTKSGARAEVWHVWRGSVQFYTHYDKENTFKANRIVYHRAEMLLHGVDRIEVYLGEGSNNMKAHGFKGVSVYTYDPEGGLSHDYSIPQLMSSYCTVQPNPLENWTTGASETIEDIVKGEVNVIIHE